MSEQHTPGPWHVLPLSTMVLSSRGPGAFSIGTSADAGQANILCSRTTWENKAEEMEANARLIATSPDGLELARMVIEEYGYEGGDWKSVMKAAQALIAKATGAAP